jgi:hypothetical protein
MAEIDGRHSVISDNGKSGFNLNTVDIIISPIAGFDSVVPQPAGIQA